MKPNFLPTLVLTFLLYGELYQVTLRCRWCRLGGRFSGVLPSSYERCVQKLLRLRASWYGGTASWKAGASQESFDRRLLIEGGSCFRTDGRWFESLYT